MATQRQTLFDSRRFRVERWPFERDGVEHIHDIVVHPGAAVILPLLPRERVVLIHNYRPAAGGELLELPAGTLDPGESPLECARRELAEETGYRAERIVPLVTFYSSPGILTECMHAFLADSLTPGPTAHEAGEIIRVEVFDLATALEAIHDGRITDGKTALTLLYYDRFVRGRKDS